MEIFPISEIEPVYKSGMKLSVTYPDLVLNSLKDIKEVNGRSEKIILKFHERTLDFNDILLLRDVIKDHRKDIYGKFDEEAKLISKEFNILCSSSQFNKVSISKFFKKKVKKCEINTDS